MAAGRPGRPREDETEDGLTTGKVAKRLGCSVSNVHRLRREGRLPATLDEAGAFRYQPKDVDALGRKLGRPPRTDGATAAKLYGRFLEDDFRPTPDEFGRIVRDTGETPDAVLALWAKFQRGAGASPAAVKRAREHERLVREYDEQIAKREKAFERTRGTFSIIDDAPPSSRRTGT